MKEQAYTDYERIAQAIHFIRENFKNQPSLEAIAEKVHLSPFHFQRMFSDWAGVSPKKFLQYLSLNYAKQLLAEEQSSVLGAALETGLSGQGRLHDLFMSVEGMSPGEYKNGGQALTICYSFAQSPFGEVLVASTGKGICHLTFSENQKESLERLTASFPKAHFKAERDPHQQAALSLFENNWQHLPSVKLHLRGTAFQLKVWEALLKIPMGKLTTYGRLAAEIQQPTAARAVGTSIGSNPIAFLIPCHRVIQASGNLGGYMWGETRKTAIIGWEAARCSSYKSESDNINETV